MGLGLAIASSMSSTASSTLPAPASRARRLIPLALIAGAAAGGWFGWEHYRGGPTPIAYTTAELTKGELRRTVTASGTLSPVEISTVGSQVSGRVTEVLVDYNDRVTAGQVLARLDPELVKTQRTQATARLRSAQADLSRAKATADNAKIAFTRTEGLVPSGAVAAADVDAARAALRVAEAAVATAQAGIVEARAAVATTETNLTYTTIRAPIAGVVISRSVDPGNTVAASLQAPELFVIAGDLARMELHASVAEADVSQLADQMNVELAFDAYPEITFRGAVRQIRNQAVTTSNVVSYDAVIAVDNPDGKLRPGMTATATFVVAESKDAFVVSAKALRYRPSNAPKPPTATAPASPSERSDKAAPPSDKAAPPTSVASAPTEGAPAESRRRPSPGVWVLRNGVPTRIAVTVGLTDGTSTVISAPELAAGDLIITADSKQAKTAAGARSGSTQRSGAGRMGPPPLL